MTHVPSVADVLCRVDTQGQTLLHVAASAHLAEDDECVMEVLRHAALVPNGIAQQQATEMNVPTRLCSAATRAWAQTKVRRQWLQEYLPEDESIPRMLVLVNRRTSSVSKEWPRLVALREERATRATLMLEAFPEVGPADNRRAMRLSDAALDQKEALKALNRAMASSIMSVEPSSRQALRRCLRPGCSLSEEAAAEYVVLALSVACWQESSTPAVLKQYQHKARNSMLTLAGQAAQAGRPNALALLLRMEEHLESTCEAERNCMSAPPVAARGQAPAGMEWTAAGKPATRFKGKGSRPLSRRTGYVSIDVGDPMSWHSVKRGTTLMMLAAASGNADAVAACIDALKRRASGKGALRGGGGPEVVREATVMEITRTSDKGETILHHAAKSGSLEMVQRVLKLVQYMHAVPSPGPKPLDAGPGSMEQAGGGASVAAAAQRPHGADGNPTPRLPPKQQWLERRSTQGYTPLALAAKHGHSETVLALLKIGASPGPRKRPGRRRGSDGSTGGGTSATAASSSSFSPERKSSAGEDPTLSPSRSKFDTPLALAVERGSFRTTDMLLKANADPDAAPAAGSTPLMRAARHGRPDLVYRLLVAGASPSKGNAFGLTPLMEAAKFETTPHLETLRLLLGNALPESDWVRHVTISSDGESEQYVHMLKKHPGTDAPVKQGIAPTPTPRTKVKVGKPGPGADPDAKEGVRGETALHRAARAGASLALQLLLNAGSDANVASVDGETPLFLAAKRNDQMCMIALMAGGADFRSILQQQDERTRRGHRGPGTGSKSPESPPGPSAGKTLTRWSAHAGRDSPAADLALGADASIPSMIRAAATLLQENRLLGGPGAMGAGRDPLNEKRSWPGGGASPGAGASGGSSSSAAGQQGLAGLSAMQMFDMTGAMMSSNGAGGAEVGGGLTGSGAPLALAGLASAGQRGPTSGAMCSLNTEASKGDEAQEMVIKMMRRLTVAANNGKPPVASDDSSSSGDVELMTLGDAGGSGADMHGRPRRGSGGSKGSKGSAGSAAGMLPSEPLDLSSGMAGMGGMPGMPVLSSDPSSAGGRKSLLGRRRARPAPRGRDLEEGTSEKPQLRRRTIEMATSPAGAGAGSARHSQSAAGEAGSSDGGDEGDDEEEEDMEDGRVVGPSGGGQGWEMGWDAMGAGGAGSGAGMGSSSSNGAGSSGATFAWATGPALGQASSSGMVGSSSGAPGSAAGSGSGPGFMMQQSSIQLDQLEDMSGSGGPRGGGNGRGPRG